MIAIPKARRYPMADLVTMLPMALLENTLRIRKVVLTGIPNLVIINNTNGGMINHQEK